MTWQTVAHVTRAVDTESAIRECFHVVRQTEGPVRGLIVYFTLAHDPEELAPVLAECAGGIPTVAASVQGITAHGVVEEEGYLLGMFAWVGDISVDVHSVTDIPLDTRAKGRAIGERIAALADAQASFLFYDPLRGVNARSLLQGIADVAGAHPVIGAATAGPWGRRVDTFQFDGETLMSGAAVVMTIGGELEVVTAASTGTVPSGFKMTVTRSEGNRILEFDGRPALQIWYEHLEPGESLTVESMSCFAIGIERGGPGSEEWAVLAPFHYDVESSSVYVQADVPEGSIVEMHRRSPSVIFQRAEEMAAELRERLAGRRVGAVLSFECGARTSPFLGLEASVEENLILQRVVGRDVPWLGLLAWGEVVPMAHGAEFFNYTYPVAMICHT